MQSRSRFAARSYQYHDFVAACFLAALVLPPARADQIAMKNGDRVTGSIVKKDGKNLTIKTDQFGVVTTAWDQVESIKTDKPVNVVLGDGRTAQGTLASAGANIEVTTPSAKLTVTPAEIASLRDGDEQKAFDRLQHPGWTDLWAGTASLGLAGTKGNAQALTFTVGANAARATSTDKTSVYFNSIRASALVNGTNSQTADAVRGGWAYNHNINSRLFVGVFNDYEYDKFQHLDLRFVLGGSFGYHLLKTGRSQMDVLGGFDYNRANYFNPATTSGSTTIPASTTTTSAGEIMLGDDYSLKLSANTSLVQSFRFFDSMGDTSAYRLNFDVGASTKIAKWLTWNVSLSDRDNHKPAAGRKNNDFLYSTGLGITFAR